jgi:Acyl-CoA reductase (LuxC)
VIVSQIDEPVEFSRLLGGRVANLVPVDSLETPIRAVNAYTQTIGIYPESLKSELRNRLGIQGAQRLVSLGYATGSPYAGPQDGIEPLRRLVRWVVEECYDPAEFPFPSRRKPLWGANTEPHLN